ncbi:MAG: ATP-binding protein [Spirochaetales bacterium]|nr:ATP-binding protein [Spirochaetales bacterium]
MTRMPEHALRDLADDLLEAIFITDSEGCVLHMNERATSIVRLPRFTAAGRPLSQLLPKEVATMLTTESKEALASGLPRHLTKKSFILPGWGFRYYDIRVIPYRRPDAAPWVALLLLDITNRARREVTIERARESAESEAQARRAFLARMSHEIRTPMNGIIGMTDLALQSSPEQDIQEYLGVIKNAADSLLVIINDVLDFAKVESGRLELEHIPVNLPNLLSETIALLSPGADEKGVNLSGTVDPSLPQTVLGDPTRIRQILTNLIGNAVKFTEEGNITVRLEPGPETERRENDDISLSGWIRDTGIGIPADRLNDLFEPFTQNDAQTGRTYGGTGLGLAICRTLARLMGGDIDAESVLHQGSIFRFHIHLKSLPADWTPPGPVREPNVDANSEHPKFQGKVALLAEDNRVNRIVALHLLERIGLTVIACENGEEAVQSWKQKTPDIILMDLQMPVMDGFEATKRIREIELEKQSLPIPIIALTAHVLDEEQRAAQKAGMNGWVTKPVKPEELYTELARHLPSVVSPEERENPT